MKTRAAAALAKAQRVEETGSYLTEQSAEVLNIIANFLADPLWTCRLGRLASTCKTLKVATTGALLELRPKHDAAMALMRRNKHHNSDASTDASSTVYDASSSGLTASDMPTLVNMLKSEAMMKLESLDLGENSIGDEGAITLSTAAASGGLPQIKKLRLYDDDIGVAGMQVSPGLCRRGVPRAEDFLQFSNAFGDAGRALSAAFERGGFRSSNTLARISQVTRAQTLPRLADRKNLESLWLTGNDLASRV